MAPELLSSSFRDPSGFIFKDSGQLYRQINLNYKDHYDHLHSSGLYQALTEQGLLIPHVEVDNSVAPILDKVYKVIKPELIPMISYPYEWSFHQLKDAALLTLKIQKIALSYGMTLKDSSAYNIQFYKGIPILIDTLSFEIYNEGTPWTAYGQFCRHFYAPVVLMSKCDMRLNQLFRIYMDGIPLDLASSLLSKKTYFNLSILGNIHLHAKYQKRYAYKKVSTTDLQKNMKKSNLVALLNSLQSSLEGISWKASGTEWGDYYNDTNYSSAGFQDKIEAVDKFVSLANPKSVWDVGGNVGVFSRIPSKKGIHTVSFDIDPVAVDRNYTEMKKNGEQTILPLLLDVTNPSPGIGWSNMERDTIVSRGPVDMLVALALIHHLCISNHISFGMLAGYFHNICEYLLIEFVPKDDSQVQRLLSSRKDIFVDYTEEKFKEQFLPFFDIIDTHTVLESKRTLYLFRKKH